MMEDIPLSLPLLMDGATGTRLQACGMPQGCCTEEWILSHPETLVDLQRRYVEAGARVLLTPTLGASPAALEPFGLSHRAGEYNERLAALTRQAAAGQALVAGDLGPSSMKLVPEGTADFESLVDNYKTQVGALRRAGVDLYLAETMLSLAEARAAVLAVAEADPGKPMLVSFYCDDEGRAADGTDVLAALITLQGMGIIGFGLNCAAPGTIAQQLVRLAQYSSVPLLAMPGFPEPEGEDALAHWAVGYTDLGVRFFGGCCGTTPEQISALGAVLDALSIPPFVPQAQDADVIPCASSRNARFITPDVDVSQAVECSPNLLEDILRTEDEPHGALKIAILDEDDLALFAAHQYAVDDALCLWSDVPELLERALRLFQGRAFWDHTADLSPQFLAEMRHKYGLILL